MILSLQLLNLLIYCNQFSIMVYRWEWWVKPSLTSLLWLGHLEKPFLLLFVLCKIQFQLCLGLPHPSSTQPDFISILFPGHLS